MATDQEKAALRNILVGGVRRMTVFPTGETTTEYNSPAELRKTAADLATEDLNATGRRPVTTILVGTSKGIC